MQEWKIKVIVEIIIATFGAILIVKYPAYQIHVIILTAVEMILVVVLWPSQEEVEELYPTPNPALERLEEMFDQPHKQMTKKLKEMGWKPKKVKKWRWPWDRFFE